MTQHITLTTTTCVLLWAMLGSIAAVGASGCNDGGGAADADDGTSGGTETDTEASGAFFSPEERDRILSWLGPLPDGAPANPSNIFADDLRAAELGQAFFYDGRLSAGNANVSCATCHDPSSGFSDTRANTSDGIGFTQRSSMSLLNGAYGAASEQASVWQFWDGRRDSQWAQALAPVEDLTEMGGSRSGVALLILNEYRQPFEEIFGPMPALLDEEGMPLVPPGVLPGDGIWETFPESERDAVTQVYVGFGKAIEAYERQLVSRNSRFDQFWQELSDGADDSDAMTELEKEGLRVFIDKGRCLGCHSGPNFTDSQFHNLAVPQLGDNVPPNDSGRAEGLVGLQTNEFNCAGPWSDHPNKDQCGVSQLGNAEGEVGAFKTPTLRSVTLTPPYMHTGHMQTLDEVISHYDLGGGPAGSFDGIRDELMRPLGLDLPERKALVAFLGALEGEPLSPSLLSAP